MRSVSLFLQRSAVVRLVSVAVQIVALTHSAASFASRRSAAILYFVAFALQCATTASFAAPAATLTGGALELTNEYIRISLDAKSGSIASIIDVASGINLASVPQSYRALWGINQSSTGNSLSGPYTDNNGSGPPSITVSNSPDEASATLVWTGLNFAAQRIPGARLSVTVAVRSGEPLSHWTFQASGIEGINATELSFPMIGSVGALGVTTADNRYFVPEQDGRLYVDPIGSRLNKWCRYPTSYMSMQFSAFYNLTAGFYLAAYDSSGQGKAFSWYSPSTPSNSASWTIQHFFPDQPADTLTLPYEVVLGVFHGDWTAAADVYKLWAKQQPWFQEASSKSLPAWFKSTASGRFQCTGYCGLAPQYTYSYATSLVEESNDQAVFGGPTLVWFNGFEKGGLWVFGDELPPSEGWANFDTFVTGLHRQGNYLEVLVNLQRLDSVTPLWQSGTAAAGVARNKDTSAITTLVPNELGTTHNYYNMSAASPLWQQNRINLIKELAAHNIDAFNLDGLPLTAFLDDYSSGHPPGLGGNWQWLAWKQLLVQAEQAGHSARADLGFSTEETNELLLPYTTYYKGRSVWSEAADYSNRGQPVPAFGYVYKPWAQEIPDYWPLLSAGDTETSYHRLALARTLVWGQGPPFLYGQLVGLSSSMLNFYSSLAKAHAKYSACLVDGTMLPAPVVSSTPTPAVLPVGFIGGGNPYTGTADAVQYGAWRSPSGEVCVVLVNITSNATSATVPIDFDRLGLIRGSMYVASVESGEATTSLGDLSATKSSVIPLQPLEIAVVKIAPKQVAEQTVSYQGLWWASPAGSESGWGINLAHQGDLIFATWFTYDVSGKAWWLSMTATQTAPAVYQGQLVQTHGPAFSAVPFDPNAVTRLVVGNATLTFTDANTARFDYTVNGASQSKTIVRQLYGVAPTCTFGAQPNLALATNYQDLWWAAPAGSESGWGINLTEQSNVIFGTWFTYDVDGTPLWLSVTANNTATGVFTGALMKTSGPPFSAIPFDPSKVTRTQVGTATFTFQDGAEGTFAYTVGNVSQVKPITRQVFVSPGTACQ